MALPKKIKKNINIKMVEPDSGPEAYIQGYLDKNPGNLPRGIDFTDLDDGFVGWANTTLEVIVEGEKVPFSFLTAQRWSEFTRTWQSSDKYKNIKIPFISIVRKPDAQPGTNPADFNIPLKDYQIPISVIPTWDGNKKGANIFSIPQPVGVDLTYTLRFFTYRMSELNLLNQKVLTSFASAQSYVNIKGHYFPIMLESIGDESTIDDIEGKRYYVQTYELRMMAYLLDEDRFEIKPALERAIMSYEVVDKKARVITNFIKDESLNDKTITCIVQFMPGSPTTVTFNADGITQFISVELSSNVSSVVFYVNGNPTSLPFSVTENDSISLNIVRTISTQFSEITLRGVMPI